MTAPKKILVLDDNRAELNLTKIVLEEAGFEVVGCEVSVELVNMLIAHKPDAILLDVRMPLLTGDSLCELVRPHTNTKIALYSGLDETKLQELVEASGADGYIRKTEDPDALVESVRRFVEEG